MTYVVEVLRQELSPIDKNVSGINAVASITSLISRALAIAHQVSARAAARR
jgi:hypothetical protein